MNSQDADAYTVITCGDAPVIIEELPADHPVDLYFVCNSKVVLHHPFLNRNKALKKIPQYKKILK